MFSWYVLSIYFILTFFSFLIFLFSFFFCPNFQFLHVIRSRLGWSYGSAIVPSHSSSTHSSSSPFSTVLPYSVAFSFSSPLPYFSIRKKEQFTESFLPLLPIPLFRARLLESLGAVTMCCFIDDDIICEGYSGRISFNHIHLLYHT